MPPMLMAHESDPKQDLLGAIGSLDDIEVFNNQILVAVYVRPEKTKSGIILTDNYRNEDRIQGKVGLVVKMGSDASIDPEGKWFRDYKIAVDDWVVFRPSDGWSITVNNVLCRMLTDANVRGRIQHPDQVW